MAKAKTLAALAGLAGLAYAMRNKDQGMTPEQNDTLANANRVSKMSDDSDTLARMNREKTPGQGAVDDTNASIVNTITASNTPDADNTTANAYPLGVMGGETQYRPPSKPAPKSAKNNKTASKYPSGVMAAPVDPRQLEAGMSRGSRYKQPTLMKKGGVVNKMASGGRTVSKKELEDSGLSLRDFLNKEKGLTRKAPEGISREYKPRDASDQESKKSMSAESGASRGSRNFAGSSRGESGGANSDALSRFNAGKEGYDEAGSAMKRGGAVKKMASGGMTASSRADGIASRGKTRGRIC